MTHFVYPVEDFSGYFFLGICLWNLVEVFVFLFSKRMLFFLLLYLTVLMQRIYDAIPIQRIVGDPFGSCRATGLEAVCKSDLKATKKSVLMDL